MDWAWIGDGGWLVLAPVFWPVFSIASVYLVSMHYGSVRNDDRIVAVAIGAGLAIVWPVVLVSLLIYWVVWWATKKLDL